MAFQPCPNVASLVPSYSIPDADIAENVLHVLTTGAFSSDNLRNLCDTYVAWEQTTTAGILPKAYRGTSVSLIGVVARDLTTETSPENNQSAGLLPIVGTDAGEQIPNGITVSVKLGTGTPGRSFRGRAYWIGLTRSHYATDKNLLSSGAGVGITVAMANLAIAIHAANDHWSLCVLSRRHNNAERANGVGNPVTSFGLVDPYLDYQRRRAPGHARHH